MIAPEDINRAMAFSSRFLSVLLAASAIFVGVVVANSCTHSLSGVQFGNNTVVLMMEDSCNAIICNHTEFTSYDLPAINAAHLNAHGKHVDCCLVLNHTMVPNGAYFCEPNGGCKKCGHFGGPVVQPNPYNVMFPNLG